jgi:hypothetical protein
MVIPAVLDEKSTVVLKVYDLFININRLQDETKTKI